MTTLAGRSGIALVVIDVQNDVVAGTHDRDRVVANIKTLVAKARSAGAAVVWVQYSGEHLVRDSEGWQLVPELSREDPEALVHKHYNDAFEDTELEDVLAAAGSGHLVVAGAQSDACIRATIHGAMVRGYDVTLVGDAHTTEDLSEWGAPPPDQVIAHTNLYWADHGAPGRTAAVRTTDEMSFTD